VAAAREEALDEGEVARVGLGAARTTRALFGLDDHVDGDRRAAVEGVRA
jgi:hypothetical protein